MQMLMIVSMLILNGASNATMAAIAAEIGLAVMACCEAITEIDMGRSGRTPASWATSAMTGRMLYTTLPVPDIKVKQ